MSSFEVYKILKGLQGHLHHTVISAATEDLSKSKEQNIIFLMEFFITNDRTIFFSATHHSLLAMVSATEGQVHVSLKLFFSIQPCCMISCYTCLFFQTFGFSPLEFSLQLIQQYPDDQENPYH